MKNTLSIFLVGLGLSFFSACTSVDQPVAINYNSDACDYCRMTIVDPSFACELKTEHGKAYKFDDLGCLAAYVKEGNPNGVKIKSFFVSHFLSTNALTKAESLHFIKSEDISSPMGGGIAAFSSVDSANVYKKYFHAEEIPWSAIISN